MAEKELSPEILKLMDKMAKNPTSRLFVPLAEEYLKCDMLDEAILVLVDGIKNHPNYVAGRVMLGKIYLQRKQFMEAKAEFERVIQANPENILAHKKLASIYQGEGQIQRAVDACKKILMIDPSDKETKGLLSTLEKETIEKETITFPGPPEAADLPDSAGTSKTDSQKGAAEAEEPLHVEFPPEASHAELEHEQPLPTTLSVPECSLADQLPVDAEGVLEPDSPAVFATPAPADVSMERFDAVLSGEDLKTREEIIPDSTDELISTTLASLYMSQGHYEKAIEVYQRLIARDPYDEESRQGLERAIDKLAAQSPKENISGPALDPERNRSNKGKIHRLQAWLDAIRKDKKG